MRFVPIQERRGNRHLLYDQVIINPTIITLLFLKFQHVH